MNVQFLTLAVDNMFLSSVSALRDVVQIANSMLARHQLASRQAIPSIESHLVSVDGKSKRTYCGLQLPVNGCISDARQANVIWLPAVYMSSDSLLDHPQWLEYPDYVAAAARNLEVYLHDHAQWLEPSVSWLKQQRQGGAALAAVASSNLLLAEADMLQRMRMSVPVPWVMEYFMRHRYPGIMLERRRDVVIAGDIYCAGNVGSSLALAIELIRRHVPTAIADYVARQIRSPEVALETPVVNPATSNADPIVIRAMALIQQRFTRTIDHEKLVSNLAVSQRTLIRRFKHDLGMTPHVYQQQLRLEAAQHLLTTTQLTIGQIAAHVGYADAAYFSRLFRQRLGIGVQAYRAQWRRSQADAGRQPAI